MLQKRNFRPWQAQRKCPKCKEATIMYNQKGQYGRQNHKCYAYISVTMTDKIEVPKSIEFVKRY